MGIPLITRVAASTPADIEQIETNVSANPTCWPYAPRGRNDEAVVHRRAGHSEIARQHRERALASAPTDAVRELLRRRLAPLD